MVVDELLGYNMGLFPEMSMAMEMSLWAR